LEGPAFDSMNHLLFRPPRYPRFPSERPSGHLPRVLPVARFYTQLSVNAPASDSISVDTRRLGMTFLFPLKGWWMSHNSPSRTSLVEEPHCTLPIFLAVASQPLIN
jgi:hypothetical protein